MWRENEQKPFDRSNEFSSGQKHNERGEKILTPVAQRVEPHTSFNISEWLCWSGSGLYSTDLKLLLCAVVGKENTALLHCFSGMRQCCGPLRCNIKPVGCT